MKRKIIIILIIASLGIVILFVILKNESPSHIKPTKIFIEHTTDYNTTIETVTVSQLPDGTNTISLKNALKQLHPGMTIRILPGIYKTSFYIDSVGTDKAPITIEGIPDDNGNLPVFDGEKARNGAFIISYSNNFTIKNIEFKNYTDHGVYVNYSNKTIIKNNIFHNNGFAAIDPDFDGEGFGLIVTDSENVTIKNNDLYQNGPSQELYSKGLNGMAIDTYMNKHVVISNNHAYETVGGGILVEDSEDVLVNDNLIERNNVDMSFDEWWDGGIWIDGGNTVTVRNNILKNNLGPAIQISNEDDQNIYGYVVENNVMDNNYYGLYIWNFGKCPRPDESIVIIKDNEISNSLKKDELCGEQFILY